MATSSGPLNREADGLVRLSLGADVQSPTDEGGRYVDVIASTADLDREDEIVVQDWDLASYVKNPVVLWNHFYSTGILDAYDPADTLPIGFASNVRIEDGSLKARLNFVDEKANPLAPKVYEGFRQGSIRAVSVGFDPGDARVEEVDGREVLILSANRLVEISACPLPANPNAVVEAQVKSLTALRARAKEKAMAIKTTRKKADAPADKPAEQSDEDKNKSAEPMSCASCKAENAPGSKFCAQCGEEFPKQEEQKADDPSKCADCGAEIPPGSKFCPQCGAKVPEAPASDAPADAPADDGAAKSILSLTGKKSLSEAAATVAGWKRTSELYSETATQLANIKGDQREAEVARILDEGIKAGKLPPAQRKAYLGICGADDNGKGADPKRLKALVEALPQVVEIGGKGAKSATPDGAEQVISPEQRAINKRLGVSDESYLKSLAKRAKRRNGEG